MQSAQKITNAGSRVYDRSRVPTDWLKVNGEKRRRRRRRRRRRNKRKESDERRDVENRLNVALTSIGEPERAVVRVHSCPFLPGFQLFQKFKRSRDDDFFSSSSSFVRRRRRGARRRVRVAAVAVVRSTTTEKHD